MPIQAFPYLKVGDKVEFELEADLPDRTKIRYADLEQVWLVSNVDTEWGADNLTSNVTFVDVNRFPL